MLPSELLPLFPSLTLEKFSDRRDFCYFLADRVLEARTNSGQRLCDASDFRAWLREIAAAIDLQVLRQAGEGQANGEIRTHLRVTGRVREEEDPCPRCGHVHEGSQECGVEIAQNRFCHCEREAAIR